MLLRVITAVGSRLGVPPPYVMARLLGRDVTVTYGSIPADADYDYGWMYALIAESNVFYDVGCSLGIMSLVACVEGSNRAVVLVDASADALACANTMLIKNRFADRVHAIQAFISDCDHSTVEFFTVRGGAAGSRFRSHAVSAARGGLSKQVPTMTLDCLARKTGLQPDLVKLDIEGAEIEALYGATVLGTTIRPRFCVEMHSADDRPMRNNAARVLEWCTAVDYRAFYLKHHVELTDPAQIAHRGRCHVLLTPSDQPYPKILESIPQGASFEYARRLLSDARLGTS